ncbi:MAG: hypothetical protein R3264_18075, partial [Anaerolineae bacterium]|nr:hypothetical protein [Anaerolineae bacterium]
VVDTGLGWSRFHSFLKTGFTSIYTYKTVFVSKSFHLLAKFVLKSLNNIVMTYAVGAETFQEAGFWTDKARLSVQIALFQLPGR